MLSLAKTGSGAINLSGNASVNMTGCVVAANSSDPCALTDGGSATLIASDIYTVGGYCLSGHTTFTTAGLVPVTGGAPVPDPFASMFPSNPSMPVSCAGAVNLPGGTSLSPGKYTGVSLNGNSTYTFATGTYYICGNFSAGGNTTINTGPGGATFIVKGSISMGGNATGTLAAPTSGPYSGILFYQPGNSSNQTSFTTTGNSTLTATGAIYLPGGNMTFTSNDKGGSTACLEIVAYKITFTGNDHMTNTGCSADGVGLINITNVALAQ